MFEGSTASPINASRQLTILLTLKGRNLHTLRWLWHANRTCLPFHVVVADGDVNPIIDTAINSGKHFTNLSFDYFRYDDLTLKHFYQKCSDAIARVDTPYVMMSDNDDFLIPSGIKNSINFLDSNPDYICHRGGIIFFGLYGNRYSCYQNLLGRFRLAETRYLNVNYAHALASDRIRSMAAKYSPTYYNVYRTDCLKLIFEEIAFLNFSDLLIHEMFIGFRTASLGKVGVDKTSMSYLRQQGTSSGFGGKSSWDQRLVLVSFMADFVGMTKLLSDAAAQADEKEATETDTILNPVYADFLTTRLNAPKTKPTIRNAIRALLPDSLLKADWFLKARSIYSSFRGPGRFDRRSLIKSLQQVGASRCYLDSFDLELRQIEETLDSKYFLDFLDAVVGKDLSSLN